MWTIILWTCFVIADFVDIDIPIHVPVIVDTADTGISYFTNQNQFKVIPNRWSDDVVRRSISHMFFILCNALR